LIGEALEADGIALESFAENATASVEVQTWRRSGAGLVRKGSLELPVTVAGRRLSTLLIELDDAPGARPPAAVGRLPRLADLVAPAAQRGLQMRELARAKVDLAEADASPFNDIPGSSWDSSAFEDIIGDSPALRVPLGRVQQVAPTA